MKYEGIVQRDLHQKNKPVFCVIRNIWSMLLVFISTSQAFWPIKTTDLLKMKEMHHWKLSEEEERRGSPPLTRNIMDCVDWVERRKGKEVLRESTVHLCPASWKPVSKASVLRVSYSGRSCSFSEARRSWLRDCPPAACCPPVKMTNKKVTAVMSNCLVLYSSATFFTVLKYFLKPEAYG